MRVKWTQQASQDRHAIRTHIAQHDLAAAIKLDALFSEAATLLGHNPHAGKAGVVAGTREWFAHRHYRMVYLVDDAAKAIYILTLVHTARQWPPA